MNKDLSNIITWLRFPLAMLIVLQHYYTPDIAGSTGTLYWYIGNFFNHILAAIPVPLFIFISGYLYFNGMSSIDKFKEFIDIYIKKSSKRLKSLLIPYILWNLAVLFFYYIAQTCSTGSIMAKDGYKLISDYSVLDYIKAFIAIDSTGMPIDGPLWFIRDLLVCVYVFTPIIFLINKFIDRRFIIPVLCLLLASGLSYKTIGFDLKIVPYFCLGGILSLNNSDMWVTVSRRISYIAISVLSLIFILFTLDYFVYGNLSRFISIFQLTFVMLIFTSLAPLSNKGCLNMPSIISSSSFVIFALHKPLMIIIRRFSFALIKPSAEFQYIILMFAIPVLVIGGGILFMRLMKHIKFLQAFNGFRAY